MAGTMKLFIMVVATCVAMEAGVADAIQRPDPVLVISEPSNDGETWPEVMYFPDANEQPVPGRIYGQAYYIPATRDDVYFVLFTRRGQGTGEQLKLGDAGMLSRSTFDRRLPTVFVTHGFRSAMTAGCVNDVKNMYMGYYDVNVIAVDWSRIAGSMNYFVVHAQVPRVGAIVAEFVHFLKVWGGLNLGNVHLVGHSLGAHVMGYAGKFFLTEPQKIGRITGLDPAGPLFKFNNNMTRLASFDADFVDVIHTCGGWLGFLQPIGKVDFFPNGGSRQPGCHMEFAYLCICSHSRAWRYYAESINSEHFSSLPCSSYDDYQHNRNCNLPRRAPMGLPAPSSITGNYFLNTAASPPFALG